MLLVIARDPASRLRDIAACYVTERTALSIVVDFEQDGSCTASATDAHSLNPPPPGRSAYVPGRELLELFTTACG
ncbi:hypothetical protein [Streptomyces sp. NPDC049744]|uniref:hypothetical protein n=1 Tax=Streptomyces sp. NPDC049744 TaxID=3154359 RepID=UPI003446BB29